MNYAVYYPEEGQYSIPMSFKQAKELASQFLWAYIINIKTAEVVG